MNSRTCARILIAVLFAGSGLVEMLGATGLIVELSPDGRWASGMHSLAIGGPLQLVGAAMLASGHKTRWAMGILGCYAFLVCVFGNLPLISNSDVGWNALLGLLNNLAVMGGIIYWFHSERKPGDYQAKLAHPSVNPAWPRTISLVLCLALMGGFLYWLNSGRPHNSPVASPVVPIAVPAPALPVRLLV